MAYLTRKQGEPNLFLEKMVEDYRVKLGISLEELGQMALEVPDEKTCRSLQRRAMSQIEAQRAREAQAEKRGHSGGTENA